VGEIIVLIDEDEKEHKFELEMVLEVKEDKYAVLIPLDENYSDSNEAVLMKFGSNADTGEEVLLDIDDDDEWNMVADAYDEIIDEEEYEYDEDDLN
jgi:uncharacterized protein YrzB (UPF0473 family)